MRLFFIFRVCVCRQIQPLIAALFAFCAITTTTFADATLDNAAAASLNGDEQLETAASSLNSLEDTHKQEKRYIGGSWDPYSSRLGLGLGKRPRTRA